MKFRSLSLALVLVAGISLSSPAFAQDDKTKTQTPSQRSLPIKSRPPLTKVRRSPQIKSPQ